MSIKNRNNPYFYLVPCGPPPGMAFLEEEHHLYLSISSLSSRNPIIIFSSQPGTSISLKIVIDSVKGLGEINQGSYNCVGGSSSFDCKVQSSSDQSESERGFLHTGASQSYLQPYPNIQLMTNCSETSLK